MSLGAIQAICGADPRVDLSDFKDVFDEERALREAESRYADSAAAAAGTLPAPLSSVGLELEFAPFSPRSKASLTQDVFRYASARYDYTLDNPMTATRREEVMWRRRSQIIARTVTTATVVVGFAAAFYGGYRWSSHFRAYVDGASSRLRDVVSRYLKK